MARFHSSQFVYIAPNHKFVSEGLLKHLSKPCQGARMQNTRTLTMTRIVKVQVPSGMQLPLLILVAPVFDESKCLMSDFFLLFVSQQVLSIVKMENQLLILKVV